MINPLRNLPVRHTPPAGVPGCIHTGDGRLCAECWQEYLTDDEGYLEFGDHPAGRLRWKALCDEIAAEVKLALCNADCLKVDPEDYPF